MVVGKTKLYCLTRPDKSVEKQIGHWKIISFFLMTDLGLSFIVQWCPQGI